MATARHHGHGCCSLTRDSHRAGGCARKFLVGLRTQCWGSNGFGWLQSVLCMFWNECAGTGCLWDARRVCPICPCNDICRLPAASAH
eukprot:12467232-Heterocapsa_arctica.AAC.1